MCVGIINKGGYHIFNTFTQKQFMEQIDMLIKTACINEWGINS